MNNRIYLNDLLNFNEEILKNTRIILNIGNKKANPLEEFIDNPNNLIKWTLAKNSLNEGQIVIGLIKMNNKEWLLISVVKITKKLNEINQHKILYEFEELPEYKKYFGRVIIKYHNKVQQRTRIGVSLIRELEIIKILESFYDGWEFLGYDNVCLSFKQLNQIINGKNSAYRTALDNQKAIYVLTDTKTGKLYVGSATSDNGMLLTRWVNYIKSYHGENVQLKKLLEEKGGQYFIDNFQFSLIENYNSKVSDEYILKREQYWKIVLDTINHGYNSN